LGYSTDFTGKFVLNKKLDEETYTFLKKLATTRRVARNVGPEFGVEGEFYVDGKGSFGQETDKTVINCNQPPSTQPSLWLQWVPTDDRLGIEWDGGEKFYEYVLWLKYIIDKILAPKGYVLNGRVHFQGEDSNDFGYIVATNNVVTVDQGHRVYDSESAGIDDLHQVDALPKSESKAEAKPVVASHKRKISWKGTVSK